MVKSKMQNINAECILEARKMHASFNDLNLRDVDDEEAVKVIEAFGLPYNASAMAILLAIDDMNYRSEKRWLPAHEC